MALTEKTGQQKEKTTDQMASMAKFKELRNSKNPWGFGEAGQGDQSTTNKN